MNILVRSERFTYNNRLVGVPYVLFIAFSCFLCSYAILQNKVLLVVVFGAAICLGIFLRPLWGLYLIIVLIPFQLFPMAFFNSDYTFSLAQLLVKFLFAVTILKVVQSGRFSLVPSGLNFWIILFMLIPIFSTLNTPDMEEHLKGTVPNVIDLFLLYFVIANNVETKKQLKRLINILIGISLIVVTMGTLQYFLGVAVIEKYLQSDMVSLFAGPGYAKLRIESMLTGIQSGKFNEVTSIFVNHSDYGGFLLCLFPLTFGLFLLERAQKTKILYGLFALLFAFNIGVSLCRSAWLGASVAVIFLSSVTFKREIKLGVTLIGMVALLIIFESMAGHSYLDFLPSTVQHRLFETFQQSSLSHSYQQRLGWWYEALASVSKTPFFGTTILFKVHNLYLEILLLFGVLGLLVFLIIIGVSIYKLFTIFKYSDDNYLKAVSIGACASLMGLLFHSLFWNDLFFVPQNDMLFALFLGLAVVTPMLAKTKERENEFVRPNLNLSKFSIVGIVLGTSLITGLSMIISDFSVFDIFSYAALGIVILLWTNRSNQNFNKVKNE